MQNHIYRHSSTSSPSSSYRRWLLSLGIAALLGAGAAAAPLGCNGSNVGGMNLDPNDPNNSDGGTGGGGDDGGQSGYCAGSGPPIVVGDTGTSSSARCSGQVAAAAFRYGLCVCKDLSPANTITVDAFDSTAPGATTFGSGGSVGSNGNINPSSGLSVGGNLQVAGSSSGQNITVGQDLLLNSSINESQVVVGRNAQVNGDLNITGLLKVTGSLTVPAGRTINAGTMQIGSTVRAAVTVPPPCDCSPTQIFPIASYVEARRNSNDNASIGLDPDRFNNFTGDQTLNLPCGRFFLNRITGSGKLTIGVSGRTALFIGSDVNIQSDFRVQITGTGELDLFLNGNLTSSAPLNFGDRSAPARVRLYMAGSRNINLSANSVINGNIYAPEGALVTSGSLTVYGAIFVSSFNPSGAVNIHHDIAVLKAADSCTPTSGGGGGGTNTNVCNTCQDCGGQACKNNSCTANCTSDSDCCRPLSCDRGKCAYVIG